MSNLVAGGMHRQCAWALAALICVLSFQAPLPAAAFGRKMPVVPKWGRFEQPLKSSIAYSNPLQDATLTAVFISPLGETNMVYGFWDGGKVWRLRFAPDQPGRWRYQTICSDPANTGLHNRSGEFICTSATGQSRFANQGPVRVAHDGHHFEHANGTPFFWVADTTWNGARLARPKDWEFYAGVRAIQRFSVVQWSVAPGNDFRQRTAITGLPTRIGVDPEFFKRLDRKLELLSRVGLLAAIAPLAEAGPAQTAPLPDDQAVLLIRYVVARWGADPVAWLLTVDDEKSVQAAERWKKIGRAVFGGPKHAPVIVNCGTAASLLNDFRDESWVDAFAFRAMNDLTDEAFKRLAQGPFAEEWQKHPEHPLLVSLLTENSVGVTSRQRVNGGDVRHEAYLGMLISAPAGLTYSGQGAMEWDLSIQPQADQVKEGNLPLWHKALFMPGAKQMATLCSFFNSVDFWRLRPQPGFVATQPGGLSFRRYIAAAGTETKDLAAVYVAEDRTLELMLEALPASPSVLWLNPRTGSNSPAVAVVGARTCQFPTPEPGDWLLTMKSAR